MGKQKKRVRESKRITPASKPPADPELAAIREQRVLPLLKELQSLELTKRTAAARAITNLSRHPHSLLALANLPRLLEKTITEVMSEISVTSKDQKLTVVVYS